MKKNNVMRIACAVLILTLLSTSVISGTFAKYVTTAEGNDTARVAKFGVVLTAESDIFAPEYAKDGSGANTGVSVLADDTKDVVAPGTAGTMTAFTIAGAPEVDVKVDVTLAQVDPISMVTLPAGTGYKNWTTANPADTYDVAANYYPVVWTLKQDGTAKATGNLEAIQTYLTDTLSGIYEVEADTFDTINGSWTLEWAWAYENGKDAEDTTLGQVAAGVDTVAGTVLNETFDFAITVTQLD
ncbi:MAG: hypothetical protein IJ408_05515 [Clostridia bacterium]|nr:hypothetical protein [Clostridia bacterium]